MKKPDDIPEELWRYLRSRYRSRTLRAMFSKVFRTQGKREQARRLRQLKKREARIAELSQ